MFDLKERPKSKNPDKAIKVDVSLPRKLHDDLLAALEARGSDLDTFLAVAARSYLRVPSEFSLSTVLPYKKYSGELLETIIRLDPSYVRWLLENNASFRMNELAHRLLDQVDPE